MYNVPTSQDILCCCDRRESPTFAHALQPTTDIIIYAQTTQAIYNNDNM